MDEPTAGRSDSGAIQRFAHWFLVGGDRIAVSLLILAAIGAAFLVAGFTGIATVTRPRRVMWYLNGTVNGLLTLVPITVGVNQIVLSHELGSIQDLYDRRSDITEFRERVEEQTDAEVVSPHAASFFGTLLGAITEAAEGLQDLSDHPEMDDRTRTDLESFGRSVAERADRVAGELDDGTSMVRTLLVVLSYDDSMQYHETRRLQSKLSSEGAAPLDALDRINELFVEVDAARQFLKTVVVERQLARLSRHLVYTGVPAVVVAAIAIFSYRDVANLTLSRPVLVVLAGTLILATLLPLAILVAYVLRVATIALQTASYGPFVPETDE